LQELTQTRPTARLDIVPDAGHWLHVDNPGFLLELMGRDLY
jgi:pimeloyl-ACP methyl ester carboxylesterase